MFSFFSWEEVDVMGRSSFVDLADPLALTPLVLGSFTLDGWLRGQ